MYTRAVFVAVLTNEAKKITTPHGRQRIYTCTTNSCVQKKGGKGSSQKRSCGVSHCGIRILQPNEKYQS